LEAVLKPPAVFAPACCRRQAASNASVGVGKTHPYLKDTGAFYRLERRLFARARELTVNLKTASYVIHEQKNPLAFIRFRTSRPV
jgi:hypothetical protein